MPSLRWPENRRIHKFKVIYQGVLKIKLLEDRELRTELKHLFSVNSLYRKFFVRSTYILLHHLIYNMTTYCSLLNMKIAISTCWEHFGFLILFWHSEQFMYTTCSELAIFMYNLLSYCYKCFKKRFTYKGNKIIQNCSIIIFHFFSKIFF